MKEVQEIQEIKESIFDLNDSMEKAFSYFEVINRSVSEMVSRKIVDLQSGDRYPYRPQRRNYVVRSAIRWLYL
jgi:hypothetical protein